MGKSAQTIHHDSGCSEVTGLRVSKPKNPKPAVKNPTKTAKRGNVNEDRSSSVNCGAKAEGEDEDEYEDDWEDLGQAKKKTKIDDEEWQEVTVGKELPTKAEKMYLSDGDEERDLRHKATSAMRAVLKKVKGTIPEPVKKNAPPALRWRGSAGRCWETGSGVVSSEDCEETKVSE